MSRSRKKDSPPVVNPNQRWLDVVTAALYVIVSQGTIRNLIRSGELRAVRLGKGYKIDKNDLDALMLRRQRTFPPYRKHTHPWVAERHAQNRNSVQR